METVSQARIELKRRFADFLDATFEFDSQSATYGSRALDLLYGAANPRAVRIRVQSHDLRAFDAALLSTLLENPTDGLPAFQDAVREYVKSRSDEFDPSESEVQSADEKRKHLRLQAEKNEEWLVALEGDLGTSEVSPRELLSTCLGRLVKVYGIVTKCSLVRPKITKSVHYCEATKSFTSREYRDATSFNGPPTGAAMPTRDDKNNLLTTEYGRCKYLDNQMVTIQELPETAPAGQLPHSAEVVLEGDLVDSCKPGDRVAIFGVYKAYQGKGSGTVSGVCRASLVGTSVQVRAAAAAAAARELGSRQQGRRCLPAAARAAARRRRRAPPPRCRPAGRRAAPLPAARRRARAPAPPPPRRC
jgi:DNA replication licensing factor MCM3